MEPVLPMRESAGDLLTRMGELFMSGRLDEMSAMWTFPCPVEIGGELVVLRDPQQLRTYFASLRAAALAAGVLRLAPSVIAVEIPRGDRFRAWIRWVRHLRGGAREMDAFGSLYYLVRRPSGALAIEMMELFEPSAGLESAGVA